MTTFNFVPWLCLPRWQFGRRLGASGPSMGPWVPGPCPLQLVLEPGRVHHSSSWRPLDLCWLWLAVAMAGCGCGGGWRWPLLTVGSFHWLLTVFLDYGSPVVPAYCLTVVPDYRLAVPHSCSWLLLGIVFLTGGGHLFRDSPLTHV